MQNELAGVWYSDVMITPGKRHQKLDFFAQAIENAAAQIDDITARIERVMRERRPDGDAERALFDIHEHAAIGLQSTEREFLQTATSAKHLDRHVTCDGFVHTKIVVLKHPKVTSEQVTFLSDHPDVRVSSAARNHPKSWVRNVHCSRS